MKPRHSFQSGFSLLEAIIALGIVALILVLYQTAMNTVTVTRESTNQETALRIASAKAEELRGAGYDALPSSGSFSTAELSALPGGTGTVTVTDFSDTAKQVTVTVNWNEPRSQTARNISVTTILASVGGL